VCDRRGEIIELDFPATPVESEEVFKGLPDALGIDAEYTGRSRFDALVVVENERRLRTLEPDFAKLARVPARGVIVTALADEPQFDFVSRFFAPAVGINEDPVTGSAHCSLGPYWGKRLGKSEMTAFQASKRGGVVELRLDGDRVLLGGGAITVFRANLTEPASDQPGSVSSAG
jgi:PhzF family phenazine biosynthesis protein